MLLGTTFSRSLVLYVFFSFLSRKGLQDVNSILINYKVRYEEHCINYIIAFTGEPRAFLG